MHKRRLGTGGLEVSSLGYGTMGLSGTYSPTPDRPEAYLAMTDH